MPAAAVPAARRVIEAACSSGRGPVVRWRGRTDRRRRWRTALEPGGRFLTNPLWQWRIAHRRDAREVENILRLGRGRVERLELGEAAPTAGELRKLARLTGLTDFRSRWDAWAVAQPPA